MAEDKLSNEQIAETVGITRQALDKWKKRPEFRARVAEHVEAWRQAILARGIAAKQNRIDALNERWRLLRQIVAARSKDLDGEVAGGETGLLVREPMLVKVYEASDLDDDSAELLPTKESRIVYKYALDTGLLKELREHEKQAAQELGEWTESKSDHVLKYIDLTKLSTEQLERIANGDDPLKVILGH